MLVGLVMTACLDDKDYALDPSGYKNVIQFLDPSVPVSATGAIYPAYVTAFAVSEQESFTVPISFAGPQDNDQDIQLTLAVDPAALDIYNEQMVNGLYGAEPLKGGTYELLPEENYTIPTLTVTIPKGQKEVSFSVTVFPDKYDLSKTYALPFRIVSASSGILSEHNSVLIMATVVKNKYDGVYNVTGSLIDANGLYTDDYPREISLSTVNANTVLYYDISWDYPNYIVVSIATGGGANTGIRPVFIFDETTNQITAIKRNDTGANLEVGEGEFFPDDRSIEIHWVQGRWNVTEHYKFKEER